MSTLRIIDGADLQFRDKRGLPFYDNADYCDQKQTQQKDELFIQTDREFSAYKSFFYLNKNKLEGKKILNVGGGIKDLFGREAALYGAEVYSISPAYKLKKYSTPLQRGVRGKPELKYTGRCIAARAQNLPFPDDTFDYVLAFNSIPCYVNLLEDLYLGMKEMVRVVKPNHEIMIASMMDYRNELGPVIRKWLRDIECKVYKKDIEVLGIRKKHPGVYPPGVLPKSNSLNLSTHHENTFWTKQGFLA